jgi:hypothetical protein
VNHRRSNKNVRKTKETMGAGGTDPFATIMDEEREEEG